MVRHGHFDVNGRKTNIPSYVVKAGDEIMVRQRSRTSTYFKDLLQELEGQSVPEWLSLDSSSLSGRVVRFPERDEIELPLNEQLIVEYYSR